MTGRSHRSMVTGLLLLIQLCSSEGLIQWLGSMAIHGWIDDGSFQVNNRVFWMLST